MEKKREFIVNTLYIAIICGLVYFSINYLFGLIAPFIIGFIIAYFALKISRNVFKDEKRIHRIITLILFYIVIAIILALLIAFGLSKISDFIKTLPSVYTTTIEPYIASIETSLDNLALSLPEHIRVSLGEITDNIFDALKSLLSSLATGLVGITTNLVKSAPETLVSIIVCIIASFYFVIDYEMIADWFITSIPPKALDVFYDIKDFIENVLFKIIVSYLTIMGITFVELLIGLTLFGITNSVMWALIIALLDILPVLGVGTVLIPWGISSLITGRIALGIEILVLYFVIAMIRNIIEPRFVGTSLGLHPLVTLASMIIGVRLFGAIGMFGFPLALSFFVNKEDRPKMKK